MSGTVPGTAAPGAAAAAARAATATAATDPAAMAPAGLAPAGLGPAAMGTAAATDGAVAGARDWTDGEAVILVSACSVCDRRWYLPRQACPACGSEAVRRSPSSGLGCIAAVTVIRAGRSGGEPIGLALVDLNEGARMMARCPVTMAVDQAVKVGFTSPSGVDPVGPLLPYCEAT